MKHSKPIVVSGFWGRGNTGDEAMLQRIYDFLSPTMPVTLSLDRHGAYDGFWNWHPYTQCRSVHQLDIGPVEPDRAAALHIGGGGLSFSFNGAQLIHAILSNVPILVSGIDFPTIVGDAHVRLRSTTEFFTQHLAFVSFRTRWSYERYSMLSRKAHLGADWAWDLPMGDVPDGISIEENTVAIVVREENGPELAFGEGRIELLAQKLEALGLRCLFVPFSPEDAREMRKYASEQRLAEVCECWWNPQAVKAVLAKCRLVVSLGRYHPLIFAASLGRPVIYVETPRIPWQLKITTICHDLQLPMISLSDAVDDPSRLLREADSYARLNRGFYSERLDDMKHRYMSILKMIL
ncbi:polysaccharide pyruvyl transferase family protein [Cupriavidus necator]|uniref:polysaccharide pyruvyl transferase family protein n=1 Tax=Cupriavidus necator TaxID=106590 RepID=UPI003F74045E